MQKFKILHNEMGGGNNNPAVDVKIPWVVPAAHEL